MKRDAFGFVARECRVDAASFFDGILDRTTAASGKRLTLATFGRKALDVAITALDDECGQASLRLLSQTLEAFGWALRFPALG